MVVPFCLGIKSISLFSVSFVGKLSLSESTYIGGKNTLNSTYSPNVLSIVISPPNNSVRLLVRFRPIPVLPAYFRLLLSKILKRLNISLICFLVNPLPELRIRKCNVPVVAFCLISAQIYPPDGVYLNALDNKLNIIFSRAFLSVVKDCTSLLLKLKSILFSSAISV